MTSSSASPVAALFVADSVALDFINTVYGSGARQGDCLVDDGSVVGWLKLAGLLEGDTGPAPKGLLALALELRESGRALLAAAQAGRAADPAVLNRILSLGRREQALQWDDDLGRYRIVEQRRSRPDAASLLEPVARSLAEVLAEANLDRVRQCEGEDCTLLFQDLTKSHRRRWCSMAACGNRMKVAAFRARHKGGA